MTDSQEIILKDLADSIQDVHSMLKNHDDRFDKLDASQLETNLRLTNLNLRVEHLDGNVEHVEGEVQAIGSDIKELYLMQKPRTA